MKVMWPLSLSILLGLAGMGICAGTAMSGSGAPPSKAWMVVSRYGGEGLLDQAVVQDITTAVSAPDDTLAEIEAMDPQDGLIIRKEAYLYFPAQDVNGLQGYFILKMHTETKDISQKATIWIDYLNINRVNDTYKIRIYIKQNNAIPQVILLYSKHINIEKTTDVNMQYLSSNYKKIRIIEGYEFKVNPKISVRSLEKNYAEISLELDNYYLEQAMYIDKCENLLQKLNDILSVSKDMMFLWDMSKVNHTKINEALASIGESEKVRYDVSLVAQGKKGARVLWENSRDFVPTLRRKITWKGEDGRLADGEILIRVNQDTEQ